MKWIKWFIPLVAVALIGYGLLYQRGLTVPVAEALPGEAVSAVTGTVEVMNSRDFTLKTESGGRVTGIHAVPGDVVEEGAHLVQLDAWRLENERAQLQLRLNTAREGQRLRLPVTYDIADREEEIEAQRLRVERGAASRADLERLQRSLEKLKVYRDREQLQQREAVEVMKLQDEVLEKRIAEKEVYAPFAGRVVELHSQEGDLLHGGASLIRLITEDWFLEMTLGEDDFSGIQPGQEVVARLASYPGREIRGEVDALGAVVDADRKTRTLSVSLDAPPEDLAPGLTGEAYLVKDRRSGNLVIPRRALMGREVYVVENGRVSVRRVEPGYLSLERAEILDGLDEGDRVVTESLSELRDGDRVRVRR